MNAREHGVTQAAHLALRTERSEDGCRSGCGYQSYESENREGSQVAQTECLPAQCGITAKRLPENLHSRPE